MGLAEAGGQLLFRVSVSGGEPEYSVWDLGRGDGRGGDEELGGGVRWLFSIRRRASLTFRRFARYVDWESQTQYEYTISRVNVECW
jgi:hypothetical protein